VARPRRVALAAVALLALGAACGGVPSSGPVHVVRRVPAEGPDIVEPAVVQRRLRPGPPDDAGPGDIVSGFLVAQAAPDGDHAIARKYLAPDVAWNAASPLTIYSAPRIGRPVVSGDTATVSVAFQREGALTSEGEFLPPSRTSGTLAFRLRRLPSVGWRLASAPPGVMVTPDDLTRSYQRATLYFPSARSRLLVPQHVFLPEADQPAAAVVRALLQGPRGWSAPVVRSAIPDGTELLEPPTVVEGVVTVNFSREIRRAPQETLGALIAQVVWTLTEPSLAVEAVRLQVEGEVLVVPGRGAVREHRRTDWPEYDALARPADDRLFFVRDGAPYALDAAGQVTRLGSLTGVESFAVDRAGAHLAAVVADRGRRALVVESLAGGTAPRRVLVADAVTPPTWEAASDVVWVAATSGGTVQVVAVPPTGPTAGVAASSLPLGDVTSLRLSPDGVRVAAVVSGRLWVARVERTGTGARVLAEPRPLGPGVSGITALAFDGVGQVVVAGVLDRVRTLARFDVDGYSAGPLRVQGLPSAPVTALTSSAATPPERVASAGGRMWRRSFGTDWAPIAGTGTAATYAG
jgi:hypothetical protein